MTATTTTTATTRTLGLTGERADLVETLQKHRFFLRYTARGLTDEQAGLRPTPSELCIGGIIKHVTQVEELWSRFIVEGTAAAAPPEDYTTWIEAWQMLPGDTLGAILDRYAEVAARTDELAAPPSSAPRCRTSTTGTPCPRRRGSSPARGGRHGGCCCTSPPRPPSTPV